MSSVVANDASVFLPAEAIVESKTNLIINYLPQNLTEEQFKAIFQSIGPLESHKLVKDKRSGQSLCYGFVNYFQAHDAQTAVHALNGFQIENKVVKVSFARPSCDSIKDTNLYITGIPKSWSMHDLEAYFRSCGKIITSRILVNPANGQSRGVGFVRFNSKAEALCAISKLNNTRPENSNEVMMVKHANHSKAHYQTSKPEDTRETQRVRNLSSNPFGDAIGSSFESSDSNQISPVVFTNELSTMLTAFTPNTLPVGQIPGVQIPVYGGDAAGEYFHHEPIVAPEKIRPALFNPEYAQGIGKPFSFAPTSDTLKPQSYSANNAQSWSLFVYNLPPEAEDVQLFQLFGPFGAVIDAKIARNVHTNKSKCFGFVTMANYEQACAAIRLLNGFNFSQRILQVSFKTNRR